MDEEKAHRQIAREAAEEAVRQTLMTMGMDVDNPQEAQADLQTLRDLRRAKEKGVAALIWTFVTLVAGGVLTLLWDAISKGGGKG